MKHLHDAAVPSRSRRARVALPALLLVAGVVTLSACATPVAGAPTPSPSLSPSASPTASPTPIVTSTPQPEPSESPTSDTPYNGEILVVTSEVRDGALEVTAMVPGVAESGGTCTLTRDDTQESVSVAGTEGKGVTYCGLMSIPVASGEEKVSFHVGYESPQLRALSATATIEPGQ
ncbi:MULTISPECIES: hypothetical protein [Microbacterium]|uniref:Uncharacterized protein n=1 Tax=Microbacterium testaceum TaxID=2033 RepID=A0A147FCC1_MICTE|nr:hypothetical protein [Microbacterium testaceum]KTS14168.1 hypothetical protein RSA3_01300 [Microbacterium testaceum]KTS90845.1 hypothetical protein NS183_06795 [Microbacterium testaceum]